MEAQTKSGRIVIQGGKITLVREGILGGLAEIGQVIYTPLHMILGTNTDKTIEISRIKRVEYTKGLAYVTKPHIKIYYDKPKPRYVVFKKPFVDMANRQGAISEMEKVIDELKRWGVTTVEI
jgi:hypothetical protein